MTAFDRPQMHLLCSDHHGQYIPQHFAQSIRRENVRGVTDEDWLILEAGPDHEWYWEAWDDVLNNAVLIDSDGVHYTLRQDGDVWAIPNGMEWDDDEGAFVWPEDDEPEPIIIQSPPPRPQYVREPEPVGEPLGDRIAWFVMWCLIATAATVLVGGLLSSVFN